MRGDRGAAGLGPLEDVVVAVVQEVEVTAVALERQAVSIVNRCFPHVLGSLDLMHSQTSALRVLVQLLDGAQNGRPHRRRLLPEPLAEGLIELVGHRCGPLVVVSE